MKTNQVFLFSFEVQPAVVPEVLKSRGANFSANGSAETWSSIELPGWKFLFWGRPNAHIIHSLGAYTGHGWVRHLEWMVHNLADLKPVVRCEELAKAIPYLRFSLVWQFEEPLAWEPKKQLCQHIIATAQRLNAIIVPSNQLNSILDPGGRLLVSADGRIDDNAQIPAVPPGLVPTAELFPFAPPSADRIARRAMILAAVAARGFLEGSSHSASIREQQRQELIVWLHKAGLIDEMEAPEVQALQAPLGQLDQHGEVTATWRLEASAVLAWAIGRLPQSPYDVTVDKQYVFTALCLNDVVGAVHIIETGVVIPIEERHRFLRQMKTLHCRLRNFKSDPTSTNYLEWSQKDPDRFDVSHLVLIDNDLSINGLQISESSPETISYLEDIVLERHLAASWLCDGGLFSEADQST